MTTATVESVIAKPRLTTGAGWLTTARFAALLALFIAATFPEVVTGQATFFFRDFGVFTYPVAHYTRESIWHGEIPLWDPLNNFGIPFLAQWNTSCLYPPTLFYLLLPLSWSLGVFLLAHMFFAGMGMFLLARRWTGNPLAAALAGLGFAFNGVSWHMLVWVSWTAAWAWIPWVLLSVETACRKGSLRSLAWAALAGAFQMLSGAPEIILLTWLLVGAFWLAEVFRRVPSQAATVDGGCEMVSAPPNSGSKNSPASLGLLVLVAALVAGLAAAQLLPFLQLVAHSNRNNNAGDVGWALPLSGLGDFLVPVFRCFQSGHGIYAQNGQYWTPSNYPGMGVLLLAMCGLARVRDKRVAVLGAAAVMGVLLALGDRGGVYTGMRTVAPFLGFMRYPVKFLVATLFALPLLAAFGVDWLQSRSPKQLGRVLALAAVSGVLLMAALVFWSRFRPVAWEDWRATAGCAAMRALFLLLTAGALGLIFSVRDFRRQTLCILGLLVLQWADVYNHASKLSPTVSRSVFVPGIIRAELHRDPRPAIGEPRVLPTLASLQKVRLVFLPKAEQDYLIRRLALFDNCNLLDDIPKADGFFSLFVREPDEVLHELLAQDAAGTQITGLKDFLGIGQESDQSDSAGGLDWTNRSGVLPRVTAGQAPVFTDEKTAFRALFEPAFNPRSTVYLPTEARSFGHVGGSAQVSATSLAAHRMDFVVNAQGPAWVTVAQSYYPGWQATVDGRPVKLWRANYAFQALAVPTGRHEVRLEYYGAGFRAGLWISAVSALVCLGLGIWGVRNRSHVNHVPVES